MQALWTSHLQALHHTLKYIRGTIGQGILPSTESSSSQARHGFSPSLFQLAGGEGDEIHTGQVAE